jgi:lauroyl/myristoyl acyltransferase
VDLSLRQSRRWLTAQASQAALRVSAHLSPGLVNLLERCVAVFGPRAPVVARQIARNMRAAGVHSDEAFAEHFRLVGQHLTNALRVFRLGASSANGSGPGVLELARSQTRVDPSIANLKSALAEGRGAVVAAPHVCNYLLTSIRLSQEAPVCLYLRWSKDEKKRKLKRAWCEAAGLRVMIEPASATDPSSRAAACVEILRRGDVLLITPDIVQRPGRGVAVRLFERDLFLPSGAASIAMLADAPMVPAFGRSDGGVHTMTFASPIRIEHLSRTQGGRTEAMRRAMQAWTDGFESFLRSSPQTWFMWGDSRWSRFFRSERTAEGAGGATR